MSGRWLEDHGFEIEGEVFVEASQGRLILTNYATHGQGLGVAAVTRCGPAKRRAKENGVDLRVCAVRAFEAMQRAYGALSPAPLRPQFRRRSDAFFPWNTRSDL